MLNYLSTFMGSFGKEGRRKEGREEGREGGRGGAEAGRGGGRMRREGGRQTTSLLPEDPWDKVLRWQK